MIGGVGTIETFGIADEVCGRVRDIDARLAQESYKAVFFSSLANPTMRFMNSLVYAAIGIFGAFVVLGGGITVGGLSAFLQYADQYAKPFNDITGVVTELQNSVACARHLFELIDEPLEEPDAEDALELGRVEGRVALDDVTFSYAPGRPILEHLDLPHQPAHALLRRRFRQRDGGRPRRARPHARKSARQLGHGLAGHLGKARDGAREHRHRPSRRHRRRDRGRRQGGLRRRVHPPHASRLRHRA